MKNLLLGLIIVLLIGLGVGYFFGWYFQPQQQLPEQVAVVVVAPLPEQEVQLFFANASGAPLVQETALIAGCEDETSCVRGLVEALLVGSQQGGLPVIPAQTQLLGVEVENDLVRLNFSAELINFHPGGSLSELQTIYSLANSLSLSFPYIRQIQILVDGESRQTLKGHVRIDQPVYADLDFGGQQGASGVLSVDGLIEEVVNEN